MSSEMFSSDNLKDSDEQDDPKQPPQNSNSIDQLVNDNEKVEEQSDISIDKELMSEKTEGSTEVEQGTEDNENIRNHNLDAIKHLKEKLAELHSEKDLLQGYVKSFQAHMSSVLTDCTHHAQDAVIKIEGRTDQKQSELFAEMKSMNHELNQRGDAISKLKGAIAANKNQIKELLDEKEEQNLLITQLEEELNRTKVQQQSSMLRIKEMESEMGKFKDGDGLSTSTVSRADEVARLKDIEDTFEDRYIKLRKVAAKLKKQATEVTQQLEVERQKASTEKMELLAKLNQISATARNTQSLQQECDRLCDELEKEKENANELRKAAVDIKGNEVNLKVRLEEAQTAIEVLKIDLNNLIEENDTLVSKLIAKDEELESAKKDKAAEELIRKEKTKEVSQLMDRLKEEQEKNSTMMKTVEAAKIEARKQSVLSLEMQDYEKSLSDMKNQLTSEKTHVSSLEAEVATLQDIRSSLMEQIKLIEERLTTEESRWEQTNEQLIYTRSCLQSAEAELIDQTKKVAQLTEKLENERATSEAAALKLATLSSAVQNNTDILIKDKQSLTQQVANLTSQLASTKDALERSEEEITRLRDEFDKYKVRAQSVLRQHQSNGPSRAEKEAKQEAEELRESLERVKAMLDKTRVDLERTQTELTVSTNEREAAETRCVNLNIALEEKSKTLDRTVSEHRTQKLSMDTLLQCYKSQLDEKEKSHQEIVNNLHEEIASLRKQLKSKRESSNTVEDDGLPSPVRENDVFAPVSIKPNSPLWERGDGEGSENTNGQYSPTGTPPQMSPKPLLPLDKLLASNDIYIDHNSMEAEILNLRSEIDKNKVRLHHQAALLSESEQDAARNKELITCLKKEIGRLERCIKMQPHAQNTEYLKNIVFKFVTLDHGDDRLRLVPVISTLLQLSPEETQSLTSVAKGEVDVNTSWGSYFPSWR